MTRAFRESLLYARKGVISGRVYGVWGGGAGGCPKGGGLTCMHETEMKTGLFHAVRN